METKCILSLSIISEISSILVELQIWISFACIFEDLCIVTWAQRCTTSVQLLQIHQRCGITCGHTLHSPWEKPGELQSTLVCSVCLNTDFEGLPQNGPRPFPSHNRQLPKQGGPEREEQNSLCSHSNVTHLTETLITVRPVCLRQPDRPKTKTKNTFISLRARWVLHSHFTYR